LSGSRYATRRAADSLKLCDDLGGLGKTPFALLREDEHVAVVDVELVLVSGDRRGGASRLLGYLGRETRGP
jgi:hypothetical protein